MSLGFGDIDTETLFKVVEDRVPSTRVYDVLSPSNTLTRFTRGVSCFVCTVLSAPGTDVPSDGAWTSVRDVLFCVRTVLVSETEKSSLFHRLHNRVCKKIIVVHSVSFMYYLVYVDGSLGVGGDVVVGWCVCVVRDFRDPVTPIHQVSGWWVLTTDLFTSFLLLFKL